ncbi:unnamed protein product, partial [Polarella glacialis]
MDFPTVPSAPWLGLASFVPVLPHGSSAPLRQRRWQLEWSTVCALGPRACSESTAASLCTSRCGRGPSSSVSRAASRAAVALASVSVASTASRQR